MTRDYDDILYSEEFETAWAESARSLVVDLNCGHKIIAWFFWCYAVDRCDQNAIDGRTEGLVQCPEVDRAYGRWTETEWRDLIDPLLDECKRILKPKGSIVLVLQPNSEKVGSIRPWLWKFLAHWSQRWNMVQDAWWWNPASPPTVHCQARYGLMRPSVKICAWFGAPNCYRNQDGVLWSPSEATKAMNREDRALRRSPSGQTVRHGRIKDTVDRRGGVTPFNLLPLTNTNSSSSGGAKGHGAATPLALMEWWIRYLCPPGGVVVDPFAGSGTCFQAAKASNVSCLGIERDEQYFEMAKAEAMK